MKSHGVSVLQMKLRWIARVSLASVLFWTMNGFAQQQSAGTLRGVVADTFGGVIVGANVVITNANGVEKTTSTDQSGRYVFAALAPGHYSLRASAPGFALYENATVEI